MSDKELGMVNGPEVSGSQTQAFINALKSGASLSVGADSNTGSINEVSPEGSEDEVVASEESTVEAVGLEVESSDADNQAVESIEEDVSEEVAALNDSEEALPASKVESDILEINITDDKGRRKVKVDFADKDKLTKFVQLAYGARKWQKERDEVKKQLDEKVELWNKFEEAWKGGYRNLINTLEQSDGAFDKMVEEEILKRQELEDMSPAERKALEVEERIRKQQLESDKLKSDYENKLKLIEEKEQLAAQKELESRIHPAFERYRFSGKLGDSIAEHEFDTMLWQRTLARLESLPEDKQITPAMIDKEFRTVSQMMSKHINAQAEKKAQTVIEQKKKVAASKVQAAAKRGIQKNTTVDELRDTVRSGNLVDGLTNFFKSGGKLSR